MTRIGSNFLREMILASNLWSFEAEPLFIPAIYTTYHKISIPVCDVIAWFDDVRSMWSSFSPTLWDVWINHDQTSTPFIPTQNFLSRTPEAYVYSIGCAPIDSKEASLTACRSFGTPVWSYFNLLLSWIEGVTVRKGDPGVINVIYEGVKESRCWQNKRSIMTIKLDQAFSCNRSCPSIHFLCPLCFAFYSPWLLLYAF